jgi:hypothetical protein
MTDEQIVKALEQCASEEYCSGCSMLGRASVGYECMKKVMKDAADLIKRQQEEIESLEADYENVYKQASADILASIADGGTSCEWCIDNHRSEAVREFAERLKKWKYQSSDWSHGEHPFVVEETDIDDLVIEMTEKEGGNNGTEDKH